MKNKQEIITILNKCLRVIPNEYRHHFDDLVSAVNFRHKISAQIPDDYIAITRIVEEAKLKIGYHNLLRGLINNWVASGEISKPLEIRKGRFYPIKILLMKFEHVTTKSFFVDVAMYDKIVEYLKAKIK